MIKNINRKISESINLKQKILEDEFIINKIAKVVNIIIKAYKTNKKILIAGNGGSAADSQHFAAELVSRFYLERKALSAIALTTDTSIITSIGNDYNFDEIFKRQLEANAQEGDIFIALSTSGNSKNIIKALEFTKQNKITSVGFTGKNITKINELCDICINVPSTDTPRIQEAHILILHIICELVEQNLFSK